MDAIDTPIDPGRLLKLTRRCSRADRATFNTRNLRNFKSTQRTDDALRNANGHPSYSTSSTFALQNRAAFAIVLRRPSFLWLLAFGEYPFQCAFLRECLSLSAQGSLSKLFVFCFDGQLLARALFGKSSLFLFLSHTRTGLWTGTLNLWTLRRKIFQRL